MGTVESFTQMHAENPSETKSAHAQSAGSSTSREQKTQARTKIRGREEQKQGWNTRNKIPLEMSRIFSRPKWK